MIATIIAIITLSILFIVFALCVGYRIGREEFFRQCKAKDYVVYTRENFENIKAYEREQGRKRAYRDYVEHRLKEESND